jgi:hypothetical protein
VITAGTAAEDGPRVGLLNIEGIAFKSAGLLSFTIDVLRDKLECRIVGGGAIEERMHSGF